VVQGWPDIAVPAAPQERVVEPAAKVHASPAGQPHWGGLSLQGFSEHVPPDDEDDEVVVVDELLALLEVEPAGEPVLETVVSVVVEPPVEAPPPPMPRSDEPRAQETPTSTATETLRSKPERMTHLAKGAYADRPRGQRLPRARWNTIRIRPGPA
jgi:hypothetical protein